MRFLRSALKWSIASVLVLGVIGAIGAYIVWSNKNQLLRQQIQERFAEIAPAWELQLGQCRFDLISRIRFKDLILKARDSDKALTVVPECVITVDRELLFNQRQVAIRKVRLLRPKLELIRNADGTTNWQNLPRMPKTSKLPTFEIVEGTIVIQLHHRDSQLTPAVITLTNIDLTLAPLAQRQFQIEGSTRVEQLGELQVVGRCSFDKGTGTIQGVLNGLKIQDELVDYVSELSPQTADRLQEIRKKLIERLTRSRGPNQRPAISLTGWPSDTSSRTAPNQAGPAARASVMRMPKRTHPTLGDSAFGLSADAKVDFRISRWKSDAEPEFKIWLNLLDGEISNPLLPFTLKALTGTVFCDNRQYEIRELKGSDGEARVELNARVFYRRVRVPGRLDLQITNLAFDDRLRNRIGGGVGRMYDLIRPQGVADVQVSFTNPGQDRWKPVGGQLTAKGCACLHQLFPYPVRNITGTLTQRGTDLQVDMQGFMSRQPVKLTGFVKNPGPTAASRFDLRVKQLPIDDTFRAACSPANRATIDNLKLRGFTDAYVRLTRPAGLNREFSTQLVAHLNRCSLHYEKFPYLIDEVTGTIKSVGPNWTFSDLKGTHGTARLAGFGSFTRPGDASDLKLTIVCKDAELDDSLRLAVPPSLQEVWAQFAPSGKLDLRSEIRWTQGRDAVIHFPQIHLTDGRILMKTFPYPIGRISADMDYRDGTLTIATARGFHVDTPVQTEGNLKISANGDWRARLSNLIVENLAPDPIFLRALPSDVGAVFEQLDPQQRISITGMLEFAGTRSPDFPVTAAWDVDTRFYGGTIVSGLEFDDVWGVVNARGTWNGSKVSTVGTIDLAEMKVFDYHLQNIRGPFRVEENVLMIGSLDVLSRRRGENFPVDHKQRLTAEAIDGIVFLDAMAALTKESGYRVKLELSHGMLEKYAAEYMPRQEKLRGVMNGWVDLRGRGSSTNSITGQGQLQISPAALYELPIMVQVFNALRLGSPDTTAFKYGLLDFNIANNRYQFNSIDLIGDTASLHSRGGSVGFDGALSIDFFSRLPRTQLPIPIIDSVLGQVTKGWVGIEVRGNVNDPVAKLKPAPVLGEALNQFLKAFEIRPQFNLPNPIVPPSGPLGGLLPQIISPARQPR